MMLAMWVLMMTAMMPPSPAPMLLLFAAVCRKERPGSDARRRTGALGPAYERRRVRDAGDGGDVAAQRSNPASSVCSASALGGGAARQILSTA